MLSASCVIITLNATYNYKSMLRLYLSSDANAEFAVTTTPVLGFIETVVLLNPLKSDTARSSNCTALLISSTPISYNQVKRSATLLNYI